MVSVVIINYNTWELTQKLCENILDLENEVDLEIIVVDNDSEGTAPDFYHNTARLKLVYSGSNLGFAGGVNFGVKEAQYDYICVLNSDIILKKNQKFFTPLFNRLQQENVGLVSPKILYRDDGVIQFAGFTPINKITGRGFAIGYHQKDNGQYNTPCRTSRGHGAAMMFKKSIWEELGGLNEHYFLYYEEMDFCHKMNELGYEIWYDPTATAYHIGSFSIVENATPKVFYIFRNRIWYLRENTRWYHKIISMPYLLMVGYLKFSVNLIKGDFQRAGYILKGTNQGLFTTWS